MKRTYEFVSCLGSVPCQLPSGEEVNVPVFIGILKHPTKDELYHLLRNHAVAKKYTIEALRIAPWQVLKHFPNKWLLECLSDALLPAPRKRAVEYLLE